VSFSDSQASSPIRRMKPNWIERLLRTLKLLEDDFLDRGMTPGQARRAARIAYGGVEKAKQMHRNERGYQGLAGLGMDILYTLRQWRRSPGFTLMAVLMLAFGIGATTAVFSIVEGVLLRPLPYADPGGLVVLGDDLIGSHWPKPRATAQDVRNYMRDTHSFLHLGGYQQTGLVMSSTGDPVRIAATRMSGDLFPALAVEPLLGRWFTQQEDNRNQSVAVLSYGTWRSRFHGDTGILGTKILLDRKPYLIIGVML